MRSVCHECAFDDEVTQITNGKVTEHATCAYGRPMYMRVTEYSQCEYFEAADDEEFSE